MFILGAGRVGTALAARSEAAGYACTLVGRGDVATTLETAIPGDPILVTVRAENLASLLDTIPARCRDDLVFLQNGAIRDLLRARWVSLSTRGILYFAVPTLGAPIEPGLDTPFCGPHAALMTRWFGVMGLPAAAVDWGRFSVYEFEKLLWLAIFGVLCEAYNTTVGDIATNHMSDVTALEADLHPIGRATQGVDTDPEWTLERMRRYALMIPNYRASVREWAWRNGWLYARSQELGIATPVHDHWLAKTGHLPK